MANSKLDLKIKQVVHIIIAENLNKVGNKVPYKIVKPKPIPNENP